VAAFAIVDTNVLVHIADATSLQHEMCEEAFATWPGELVIPALCIGEACYLIGRDMGPVHEARFLAGLGLFDVVAPEPEDWPRIAALVRQYADFPLGGTDASIIALAERLDADTVLTLDHRHFAAIQPRHCEHLKLLPE
jgi:uncharacterized protein